MSADNIVVIIKQDDGTFKAYHRGMSAYEEGQYDVGAECPCIRYGVFGDDCDTCNGTGIVVEQEEKVIFKAESVEDAIYKYHKWKDDEDIWIVEYGYTFEGI